MIINFYFKVAYYFSIFSMNEMIYTLINVIETDRSPNSINNERVYVFHEDFKVPDISTYQLSFSHKYSFKLFVEFSMLKETLWFLSFP